MELHRASHARSQGTWATENPWLARDPRCHLLRPKKWLPVASTPSRLSSMAHRLSLLQKMAHREGTWERINQAIRERLRVRLKRNPQPSAGIVDSQGRSRLPEWAEKNVVTMEVRRSRVASATSWWTPRVSYSGQRSTAPR